MRRAVVFVVSCLVCVLCSVVTNAGGFFRYPPISAMIRFSDLVIVGTVKEAPPDNAQKYWLYVVEVEKALHGKIPPSSDRSQKDKTDRILLLQSVECDGYQESLWWEGKHLLFLKRKEVKFEKLTQQWLREKSLDSLPRFSVFRCSTGHGAILLSDPRQTRSYKEYVKIRKERPDVYGTDPKSGTVQPRRLKAQYGIEDVADYVKAVEEFIRICKVSDKERFLEELAKVKDKGKVYSESVDSLLQELHVEKVSINVGKRIDELLGKLAEKPPKDHKAARQEILIFLDKHHDKFKVYLLNLKWRSCTTGDPETKELLEQILEPGFRFGLTSALLKEMPDLFKRLISPDPRLREKAIRSLKKSDDPDALKPLIKLVGDKVPHISKAAAEALVEKNHVGAVKLLEKAIANERDNEALSRLKEVLKKLQEHMKLEKEESNSESGNKENNAEKQPAGMPKNNPENDGKEEQPEGRLVEKPERTAGLTEEQTAARVYWFLPAFVVALIALASAVVFLLLRRKGKMAITN